MNRSVLLFLGLAVLIQQSFSGEIHEAAQTGDLAAIETLITDNPSVVHDRDENNDTPLHITAREGFLTAAQLLIEKGADIHAGDNENSTPLDVAAASGQREMVEFLVKTGTDLNHIDANGNTSLHFSIFGNAAEIAAYLIQKGADIHAVNNRLMSPLIAASFTGNESILTLLINEGIDPDEANENGLTPLIMIAGLGYLNPVASLIELGANVNAVDNFRTTPLIRAVHSGNPEIIDLLISKGAEIDVVDADGFSPLHIAIMRGHTDVAELLLNKGASSDPADSNFKRTALHSASLRGYGKLVELMAEKGADLTGTDGSGHTPIQLAAQYGHKDVVDHLVSRGANEKDIIMNFGAPRLLHDSIPEKDAALWYLGHCGWAIKTKNHFLIFDYFSTGANPSNPSLVNGHIVPEEINDLDVYVFVTHEHQDHYDTEIFDWSAALPSVTYIYGFRPEDLPQHRESGYTGPAYEYMGPRESKIFGNLAVKTIRANDAGVGYLVEVDGVTLYHAGDHAGWNDGEKQGFTDEIDYLSGISDELDIAFCNVTGCHAHGEVPLKEGTIYTVEKLNPKILVPTHAGGREFIYAQFIETIKDRLQDTRFIIPENRGDSYYYNNGLVKHGFTGKI